MRLNLPTRGEGHRFQNVQNTDLDQKLTYQQLLNLTHDLSKQNQFLKNQTRRLGEELRNLHTQFDIRPNDDNAELYQAIGAHPILNQYQATLVPLLDAYEYKIQEFQHQFQTVHEEFFLLEKKFQDVCKENQDLRMKLTDKTKELLEVYRNGGNEKMHSDFGQIILDQTNQRLRALVEENGQLERDYQIHKAESERLATEIKSNSQKLDDCKSKIRELEINIRTLQTENTNLKESQFGLQIKFNQIEVEKRRLEQAHERAQSLNNQLNREKEMYKNRLDDLRARVERDTNIPIENDQSKKIEELETKIAFLQAELGPNDSHKRLTKLQKDYDSLMKEKQRFKQTIDNAKIREDELNETISDLKKEVSKLSLQKAELQKNESRVNKSIETLTQKLKNDIIRVKKQKNEDIEKLEFELKHKIQMKDKKISELDQAMEKLKLQKDRLEKQASLYQNDRPKGSTKDSERAINKMKEKISLTEEVFKEQLEILENDLAFLKKESQKNKEESKQKGQQLKKLKSQYDDLRKQYEQVSNQKSTLIEEFRKVRDEYETHLKQKQQIFDDKLREIKGMIQESESKRKLERERVQEATREYKRKLEDIQAAYEGRIRELQNQVSRVQLIRQEVTPLR